MSVRKRTDDIEHEAEGDNAYTLTLWPPYPLWPRYPDGARTSPLHLGTDRRKWPRHPGFSRTSPAQTAERLRKERGENHSEDCPPNHLTPAALGIPRREWKARAHILARAREGDARARDLLAKAYGVKIIVPATPPGEG